VLAELGSMSNNRQRFTLLVRTARELVDSLKTGFATAEDSIRRLRQSSRVDRQQQEYVMARGWAERQVEMIENNLGAAKTFLATMDTLHQRVTEDLAKTGVQASTGIREPEISFIPSDPISSLFSRAAGRLGV
jgi:predicted ATP-dependent serine protease